MGLRQILARVFRPSKPQNYFWLGRSRRYHVDASRAMSFAAVFACIRFITGNIAQLPWPVYIKRGDSNIRVDNNSVYWVINVRANPEMSAFAFRQLMLTRALLLGNGFAEIERDTAGRVVALWPIDNDRITLDRYDNGDLYYRITNANGSIEVAPRDMFHLCGLSDDGIFGVPVIQYAARSIALGIAQEDYGYGFFANSGVPSGVLKHPARLSDPAMERLKKQWEENYSGTSRSQQTLILEEGMEYSNISLPPEQAQFLTARQHSVEEIARWFGVPPQKIQQLLYSNYNSMEQAAIEVVTDTLMPWVKRFEQEVDYKLLSNNWGGLYSRMDLRGLMRGTHKERAEYYRTLFGIGALSINEIRAKEELDPIDGGDLNMVPLNMAPLEMVASGEFFKQVKGPAGPQKAEPDPPEPTSASRKKLQALFERTMQEIGDDSGDVPTEYILGSGSELPN